MSLRQVTISLATLAILHANPPFVYSPSIPLARVDVSSRVLNSADNATSTLTENVSRPVTEGAMPWKHSPGLDRLDPISEDRLARGYRLFDRCVLIYGIHT